MKRAAGGAGVAAGQLREAELQPRGLYKLAGGIVVDQCRKLLCRGVVFARLVENAAEAVEGIGLARLGRGGEHLRVRVDRRVVFAQRLQRLAAQQQRINLVRRLRELFRELRQCGDGGVVLVLRF